jgi:uncharacterized protein YegL
MKDSTEIICIVDRSGSMASIADDAIGGYNAFVREQQALPGEAYLSLVLFDHEYTPLLNSVPLAEVSPLTAETYVPRGTTALLDAVGRTIDDVGARLAATPAVERPGQVVVCILTDGMENASSDYTRDQVREMIEHQQAKYAWAFQFLAANQDAFAEAGSIGIAADHAASFVADAAGTHEAFERISARVSALRSS